MKDQRSTQKHAPIYKQHDCGIVCQNGERFYYSESGSEKKKKKKTILSL